MLDHSADALIHHYIIPHTEAQTEDGASRFVNQIHSEPVQETLLKSLPENLDQAHQKKESHSGGKVTNACITSDKLPVIGSTTGFTLEFRHQSSILFPRIWTNSGY